MSEGARERGRAASGYRAEVSEGPVTWLVVGRLRPLDPNDAPAEMTPVQIAETLTKRSGEFVLVSLKEQSANWEVRSLSGVLSFPCQTQHLAASLALTGIAGISTFLSLGFPVESQSQTRWRV